MRKKWHINEMVERRKKQSSNCENTEEREGGGRERERVSKKELEFNKITSQKRKTFLNAIHKCSLTR